LPQRWIRAGCLGGFKGERKTGDRIRNTGGRPGVD
jgi:hypothetical protein